uniref:Transposase n=1 Tax=Heterorhabditis bacteriophora TaxID=37862 RepID=A0A1I7X4X3_HETBA
MGQFGNNDLNGKLDREKTRDIHRKNVLITKCYIGYLKSGEFGYPPIVIDR